MAESGKTKKLTPEEALKVTERATLEALPDAQLTAFPPAGDGFSHCEGGLCYVACGSTWYRLVDANGNQYTCGGGHGKYFDCGSNTYACFC